MDKYRPPNQGEHVPLRKNDLSIEIEVLRQRVQDLQAQLSRLQEKDGLPNYLELFERSADANLVIDGDTFVDCNEATVKMLRYANRDELLQTHPSELSPEFQPDGRESAPTAMRYIQQALEGERPVFDWVHLDANGNEILCEIRLTRLPSSRRLVRAWRWSRVILLASNCLTSLNLF